MFVEATSEENARAIAKDHIERTVGVTWFTITEVVPYFKPTEGKVF